MIPIEDEFFDVVSKAQHGLGLSDDELSSRSDLDPVEIRSLLGGDCRVEAKLERLAQALELDVSALNSLRCCPTAPEVELPPEVFLFNTAFPVPGYAEMTVNSYLLCLGMDQGLDSF